MSESEKRKQDGLNDDVPDAERKAREDDGGQAAGVTNGEVKYFKEANEDSRELTEMRSLETGE